MYSTWRSTAPAGYCGRTARVLFFEPAPFVAILVDDGLAELRELLSERCALLCILREPPFCGEWSGGVREEGNDESEACLFGALFEF